jgi:serine/threonine protein phosphatase PrpC
MKAGMFYGPARVWLKNKPVPGLAMTRSIGDMTATSVGVTAEPEIKVFKLNKSDKIFVIASDGIWDRFDNPEITNLIATHYYPRRDSEGAANHLLRESVERWTNEQGMVDDITIIVAFLDCGSGSKGIDNGVVSAHQAHHKF